MCQTEKTPAMASEKAKKSRNSSAHRGRYLCATVPAGKQKNHRRRFSIAGSIDRFIAYLLDRLYT